MEIRKSLIATTAAIAMTGSAFVYAQINANRHPHLAAAQRHGQMAFQELEEAQKANDFDMGGHAQKAKDLLEKANQELMMAVQDANKNHK